METSPAGGCILLWVGRHVPCGHDPHNPTPVCRAQKNPPDNSGRHQGRDQWQGRHGQASSRSPAAAPAARSPPSAEERKFQLSSSPYHFSVPDANEGCPTNFPAFLQDNRPEELRSTLTWKMYRLRGLTQVRVSTVKPEPLNTESSSEDPNLLCSSGNSDTAWCLQGTRGSRNVSPIQRRPTVACSLSIVKTTEKLFSETCPEVISQR